MGKVFMFIFEKIFQYFRNRFNHFYDSWSRWKLVEFDFLPKLDNFNKLEEQQMRAKVKWKVYYN